jgi:hypothetical protein
MTVRAIQYERMKAPKAEHMQSLDDWWFETEMAAIRRERE